MFHPFENKVQTKTNQKERNLKQKTSSFIHQPQHISGQQQSILTFN